MNKIEQKLLGGGKQIVSLPETRVDTLWTTVESGTDSEGAEYEKRQAMAPRTFEKCVIDGKGATLDKKLGTMQSQINSATTDIAETINTIIGERTDKDVATKNEISVLQNGLKNLGETTRNQVLLSPSGWHRIYKMSRDATMQHFTLIVEREFNMNPEEAYVLDVFSRYDGGIFVSTINPHVSQKLITKIRFVSTGTRGLSYIDLYYKATESNLAITKIFNILNLTDIENMNVQQAEIPEGFTASEYIIDTAATASSVALTDAQQGITEMELQNIETQRTLTEQELNNIEVQQELTEINLLLLEKESA